MTSSESFTLFNGFSQTMVIGNELTQLARLNSSAAFIQYKLNLDTHKETFFLRSPNLHTISIIPATGNITEYVNSLVNAGVDRDYANLAALIWRVRHGGFNGTPITTPVYAIRLRESKGAKQAMYFRSFVNIDLTRASFTYNPDALISIFNGPNSKEVIKVAWTLAHVYGKAAALADGRTISLSGMKPEIIDLQTGKLYKPNDFIWDYKLDKLGPKRFKEVQNELIHGKSLIDLRTQRLP